MSALSIEVFYGWARQGLPADLEGLLKVDAEKLRGALLDALKANIVPASLSNVLDTVLVGMQALAAERLLKPSALDEGASSET